MQYTINSSLLASLSENGFSLDELVLRLQELFEHKAFAEIARRMLLLVEEILRLRIMARSELPIACGCGHHGFVLNGHQKARQLRTSLGVIRLERLSRGKCTRCGKSSTLLLRFLGIEEYRNKSVELEHKAIEEAAQLSYRRASQSLQRGTGIQVPSSTLHGWVMNTQADELEIPPGVMGVLPATVYADGTKYKGAGGVRGELKVMIGITADNELVPVGTWTNGESWRQVKEDLQRRSIEFPEGSILVADGESGLAEHLAQLTSSHQRCQWHTVRDLYHAMWHDGGKINDIRPVQNALKAVIGIELPKEDFERVSEEEKDGIEERMETAEEQVRRLVSYLSERGFQRAAHYLDASRRYLFSYIRRWLKFGIVCPRASSFIERFFRELGRRIKKMGYNWKPRGLGVITRIILKKYTTPEEWEKYWKQTMRLNRAVMFNFKIVSVT